MWGLITQTHTHNSFNSKTLKLYCESLQGAVLSPTFFSLFLHDLPLLKANVNKEVVLYADKPAVTP